MNLIAELGHNHNGSFDTALEMVEQAGLCGADFVKVQSRTLPDAIPESQRDRPKVVPWTGEIMSYVDYRRLCEFTDAQMEQLRIRAAQYGMGLGTSVWDLGQVERFSPGGEGGPLAFVKIASASMTDHELVSAASSLAVESRCPLLMSTGGSDWEMVDAAIDAVDTAAHLVLMHATSTYPCPPGHANLRVLEAMRYRYQGEVVVVDEIGYSNHCASIIPSVVAGGLGAKWIEVHFTLDRSMQGTDQAASMEPSGLRRLRGYLDTVGESLGDGRKRIMPGEDEVMRRLRR